MNYFSTPTDNYNKQSITDIAVHTQLEFERVIAECITIGGPDAVHQLQAAGWHPEIDVMIKRLWTFSQKIADHDRDYYVKALLPALVKNVPMRDLLAWNRSYMDLKPADLLAARDVIDWALEQIGKLKAFRSHYYDFCQILTVTAAA